jgi:hypothetical protein
MDRCKPWVAFLFSFIIPGAGLVYAGSWRAGLINFGIVHAILFGLFFVVDNETVNEHIHYVFLALSAASAGYAHSVALQHAVKHKNASDAI